MNPRMEENEIKVEEQTEQKKYDWAKDIRIEVPLNEFMKMKKKIGRLQNKCEKLKKEVDEQRSEKWKAEGERDRLKRDYQKLLGINKEDEEGDDGK